MLRIGDYHDLLGHPTVGSSWEAFVIENILREHSEYWEPSYYRSRAGAEIDLVLEGPRKAVHAIEIKFSNTPRASRGFHEGCKDVGATEKFLIYSGQDQFPLSKGVRAMSLNDFLSLLQSER